MEDFGSNDKSEIDILVRQGTILYFIEVKAFTDANMLGVKKELAYYYLTLERIIKKDSEERKLFDSVTQIIPILLYSKNFNHSIRPSSYFNENFLFKKGQSQKFDCELWNHKELQKFIDSNMTLEQKREKINIINSQLFFLTWDDVLETYLNINFDHRLDNIISELYSKKNKKDGVNLVTPSKLNVKF